MFKAGKAIDTYKRYYGLKDFEKVRDHILNSKHSANLVAQSVEKEIIPSGKKFVVSILSHWRYSFCPIDKVEVASFILFSLWVNHVSEIDFDFTVDEIRQVEKEIVEKCNEMRFK